MNHVAQQKIKVRRVSFICCIHKKKRKKREEKRIIDEFFAIRYPKKKKENHSIVSDNEKRLCGIEFLINFSSII